MVLHTDRENFSQTNHSSDSGSHCRPHFINCRAYLLDQRSRSSGFPPIQSLNMSATISHFHFWSKAPQLLAVFDTEKHFAVFLKLTFPANNYAGMGLLEKLWDDTVAGPQPDSGLGRLRKYKTFNSRSNSGKDPGGSENWRSNGEEASVDDNQEAMRVTRSIMIVKPPGYNYTGGSAPVSPAGYTPPPSPFSGSRSGALRIRRRSTSDAYEKAANDDGPRSPPTHDV